MVVHSRTPRRCAGDDGSALVEAAFITPVLLYLLLGILESGLLFRTYMAIGSAAQDGARTASVLGGDQYADYEIIQDVQRSLTVIPQDQIVNLVVFKATGPNDSAPSVCATSTVGTYSTAPKPCNTYVPSRDWNVPVALKGNYLCLTTSPPVPPGYATGYCPSTRKDALVGANGPPDYIGIYISVNHKYASKLFGTTKALSATTITRIEPQSLQ